MKSLIPLCPKNSTRVMIVHCLSSRWPQTAKSIHNTAKRDRNISYGAVYKALGEMARDGIISKDGKNYKLSTSWLQNVMDFSMRTKVMYETMCGGNTAGETDGFIRRCPL